MGESPGCIVLFKVQQYKTTTSKSIARLCTLIKNANTLLFYFPWDDTLAVQCHFLKEDNKIKNPGCLIPTATVWSVKHSLSSTGQLYNTPVNQTVKHQTENHRSKALCFVFSILRYLHELQYFAIDKISIYKSRNSSIYIYLYSVSVKIKRKYFTSSRTLGVMYRSLRLFLNFADSLTFRNIFHGLHFLSEVFFLSLWDFIKWEHTGVNVTVPTAERRCRDNGIKVLD